MARALIQVNATTTTTATVAIGVPVLLSNDDEGGETTYAWSFVDQPEGTADVLSNATIENPQFTPTKEGSYQLRLVVNLGTGSESIATCSVAVLSALTGDRVPGAGETLETSTTRGWAQGANRLFFAEIEGRAMGAVVSAVTPGGLGAGAIVNIQGISTVNAGTQSAHEIPALISALGSEAAVRGMLGVIIGGVGGVLSAGAVARVRVLGIAPLALSGSPAVGAPVYVSDLGTPSTSPGTYPRMIGRVVSASGGSYRWAVMGLDGEYATDRRPTSPANMTSPDGDWADDGQTGAGPYGKQTSDTAATALIVPLNVRPGEILDAVTLDLNQGSSSALCVATLVRGSATGNTSSSAINAPSTSGAQSWTPTFTGSLVLPAACAAGERFWLAITASGANGTARKVCGATARTRPAT